MKTADANNAQLTGKIEPVTPEVIAGTQREAIKELSEAIDAFVSDMDKRIMRKQSSFGRGEAIAEAVHKLEMANQKAKGK